MQLPVAWILTLLILLLLINARFDELLSGRFYGIGAQLKEDDGKIKIASLDKLADRHGKQAN